MPFPDGIAVGLEALYLLIPASILLAAIALAMFIWAIHTGQFDDVETPAIRILFEDGTGPSTAASPLVDDAGRLAGPSVPPSPESSPKR